jgi:two-component system sensor histidine kinase KdpD
LFLSLAGVALVTFTGYAVFPVNATTVGFGYLLLVLIIASVWGFVDAALASIAATLTFNFFFFPPVGKFTIADPQNWVALFSFLATSLIASRLSTEAKLRALDAVARQQDVERLYTFSRAILLIDDSEPFPKQLIRKLADIFQLSAVVLYERRTEEVYRAGPSDFDGLEDQLRDAALLGTSFSDTRHSRVITAVRLGAEPIAGLALQGSAMPDSVLQGVANLVAIGLERARAHDLASQIEAARHSEKLRTTLLDAMAHEFKTPLTSVMAATTSLRADPDQPRETRTELIRIADEEAKHLKELIDDAVEMGRLDNANIAVQTEPSNVGEIVREVRRGDAA